MGRLVSGFVWWAALAGPAAAPPEVITLEGALGRARLHAPALLAAHRRAEEAEVRRRRLPLFEQNPVVEAAIGERRAGEARSPDLDLGVSQTLSLGGRRGARVALAGAEADRGRADRDEALRLVLQEAAVSFFRAVQAEERLQLAQQMEAGAAELLRVAERRLAAGDVADLDANTARVGVARAQAESHASQAQRFEAQGRLRILLGLDPATVLQLEGRPAPREPGDLPALLRAAEQRPDVRAAEAAVAEAEAARRLGRSLAWPELTPRVRYERDEGKDVLWAGLSFSLPLWNTGQQERAVAEVRLAGIRAERLAVQRQVRVEVESAWASYRARMEAVQVLAAALPAVEENDRLARRSYEEGQIGLLEVLLVKREGTLLREALLARRLAADEARVELESQAGVLR